MDRDRIWEFIERVTGFAAGFTTIGLLALADRVGILATLAGAGQLTAAVVAERAGADPRYTREILSGLAVAGVLDYDPNDATFALPNEHAAVVADDTSPYSMAGYLDMLPAMASHLPALTDAAEHGGGVPFSDFGERAVAGIDRANSPGMRILLTRRWLAAMPDVLERLETGGRVADVGSGSGTAALAMAEAYPNTEIVGIDADEESVRRARERQGDLPNVTFVVGDAASILLTESGFDLITAFDVVHDLADPLATLRAARAALGADGVLFMMEPNVAPELEDNLGSDRAALVYGMSTMFCMTQSLAQGGAGLGAAWGPRQAEELVREAGFGGFEVLPIDNPFSAFYRITA